MKLVRTLLAIALATSSAAALTGCSKSSDIAPLQHEATGLVKQFERKLAHLDQRRTALEERAKKIAGLKQEGAGSAATNFAAAAGQLAKLLEKTRTAPAELSDLAKGSAARVSLISRTGDLKRELGEGFIVVNAAFDAYETYLTRVESRAGDVASATPLPAGSTGTTDTTKTPNPNDPNSTSPPSPSGDIPPSSSTHGGPAQKSPGGGN